MTSPISQTFFARCQVATEVSVGATTTCDTCAITTPTLAQLLRSWGEVPGPTGFRGSRNQQNPVRGSRRRVQPKPVRRELRHTQANLRVCCRPDNTEVRHCRTEDVPCSRAGPDAVWHVCLDIKQHFFALDAGYRGINVRVRWCSLLSRARVIVLGAARVESLACRSFQSPRSPLLTPPSTCHASVVVSQLFLCKDARHSSKGLDSGHLLLFLLSTGVSSDRRDDSTSVIRIASCIFGVLGLFRSNCVASGVLVQEY